MPDPFWLPLHRSVTDPETIEEAISRILEARIAPLEAEIATHNYFLSVATWGLLPKSQTDDTTIDEEIDLLIQAHDDDENAHLDADQSLQSHRASDIIDHLAESIVQDKILDGEINLAKKSWNEFEYNTCWDSLGAWAYAAGRASAGVAGMMLSANAGINTVAKLSGEGYGDINATNWAKDMLFQTALSLPATTSQLAYFMIGSCELDGTDNSFGFKVNNGTLYAIHIVGDGEDQTEYTTEITGITLTNFNIYRAEFSVTDQAFYFYVNGILKATQTTNIPTVNMPSFFAFYLTNTSAASRTMYCKYLSVSKKI